MGQQAAAAKPAGSSSHGALPSCPPCSASSCEKPPGQLRTDTPWAVGVLACSRPYVSPFPDDCCHRTGLPVVFVTSSAEAARQTGHDRGMTVRWGVAGPGPVAGKVMRDLAH